MQAVYLHLSARQRGDGDSVIESTQLFDAAAEAIQILVELSALLLGGSGGSGRTPLLRWDQATQHLVGLRGAHGRSDKGGGGETRGAKRNSDVRSTGRMGKGVMGGDGRSGGDGGCQ